MHTKSTLGIEPDFEPGDRLEVRAFWSEVPEEMRMVDGQKATVTRVHRARAIESRGWMVKVITDDGVETELQFGIADDREPSGWTGLDFAVPVGICRAGHESSIMGTYGKCPVGGLGGCRETQLPWRAGIVGIKRRATKCHSCNNTEVIGVTWQESLGVLTWVPVCGTCLGAARPIWAGPEDDDRDESMVPPYQNEFFAEDDVPTGREPENVAVRYESGNEVRFFGPFVRLEAEQFMARFSEIRRRDDEMFDVTLVDLETIDLDEFDF